VSDPSLPFLIERLTRLIEAATDALEASYPDGVPAWQQELARQLARYSAASYMAGASVDTLSPAALAAIRRDVAVQLRFLGKFALVVQSAGRWERGWQARAAMYARSIQAPYWRGRTRLLPLPAMPGDGTTQCLTNCKCAWSVQELEGDNNYDCTWVMSDVEHCQTCKQRAQDWAPLRIREGVVQI
jgi:hypothetical protein